MPLDNDIKQDWITALRSGDYKQGQGLLRTDKGYCCLGVLADILVKKGIGQWMPLDFPNGGIFSYGIGGFRNAMFIPYCVINIIPDPLDINQKVLSDMNDDGRSFIEIADFIEKTL